MPVLYLVEQGATVRKDGGLLRVTKEGVTLQQVPVVKVEQVVVFGNVGLTTPVMHHLLREGIDCVFLSSDGRYHGRLVGNESNFGLLRQRQMATTLDGAASLAIARQMVRGKLANTRTLVMRWRRRVQGGGGTGTGRGRDEAEVAVEALGRCLERLPEAATVGQLMGLEGAAGAAYWRALRGFLSPDLGFRGRVRRPPTDPVNSLLSFGYTLLGYAVMAAVRTVGLDPFLGYLHGVHYSRPSLVLDLLEEFRAVIVDSVVVRVINSHILTAEHFRRAEPGDGFTAEHAESAEGRRQGESAVLLTEEGMRRFVGAFEERLQTEVGYEDLTPWPPSLRGKGEGEDEGAGCRVQGAGDDHEGGGSRVEGAGERGTGGGARRGSYRRVFEGQARRLARVVLGQEATYEPFLVR